MPAFTLTQSNASFTFTMPSGYDSTGLIEVWLFPNSVLGGAVVRVGLSDTDAGTNTYVDGIGSPIDTTNLSTKGTCTLFTSTARKVKVYVTGASGTTNVIGRIG